jgi:hypothetical protein
MRTIAMLVLILIPTFVAADEASKTAKVEQLMLLSNAEQAIKVVFEQMKSAQIAQLRKNVDVQTQDTSAAEEIQTRIMDLIAKNMSFEKLKPTMVKAYMEVFTEDEIDGILGFYQSPAGRAMLQKSPQLMIRMIGATQQQSGDLVAEIKKITDEVRAKYQKK